MGCCVCVLPWCVCALSNPGLRELPPELGQLGNLWQLDIEDLNVSNVPAEIRKEGRASSASPPRKGTQVQLLRTWGGNSWGTCGAHLWLPCLGRCCKVIQNSMVAVDHCIAIDHMIKPAMTCSSKDAVFRSLTFRLHFWGDSYHAFPP